MGKKFRWIRVILVVALVGGLVPLLLGHRSYAAGPVRALTASLTHAPQASTIRVAPSGSNDPACGTVDLPCQTIQYAVNKAVSGDTILVAEGTYTYDATDDVCSGPLGTTGVVCVFNKSVTILGGYSTDDWANADPDANPTLIDGEYTHRGVFLISTGLTSGLHMENFIIQNGVARGIPTRNGDDAIFAYGGGMFVDLGAYPDPANEVILRHLTFQSNMAIGENHDPYGGSGVGGGLSLRGVANPTLEYLTFERNQAWGGEGSQRGGYGIGGAAYLHMSSGASFSHITVISNTARGGLAYGSGRDSVGELGDALGGGIATHSDLEVRYADISGNQAIGGNATDYGSGAFGGALFVENATLTVRDSSLYGNVAQGGEGYSGGLGSGGGIDAHNAGLWVERSRIYDNLAVGGNTTSNGGSGSPGGGGIYAACFITSCPLTIENSIIADNVLRFGTGNTLIGGGGGGIWLQGIYGGAITHSTIARNRLEGSPLLGMAALLVNFSTVQPSVINFDYNIIAHHSDYGANTPAVFVFTGNTAVLDHTLWAANDGNTNAGSGWNEGTIYDSNPIQAETAGFVSPGPPDYDYHIARTSPAKEQAADSTIPDDIDGEDRAAGGVPDVGADEYIDPALTLFPPRPGNGTLSLTWQANLALLEGLDHYELLVQCPSGASPPDGFECGQAQNVKLQTQITLTGLTNGKTYTLTVRARDASGAELAADTVSGTPINFQYSIFMPLVSNGQ